MYTLFLNIQNFLDVTNLDLIFSIVKSTKHTQICIFLLSLPLPHLSLREQIFGSFDIKDKDKNEALNGYNDLR